MTDATPAAPAAPAEPAAPATPASAADDFDAAFAEVVTTINAESAPATAPVAPAAPAEPPAAPAAAPAAPAPAAPVAAPAAPAAPADPAAAPAAAPAAPAAPAPAPTPAAPAAAPAAPAETPEQKKAREDYEESIKPYVMTAEEQAADAQFKKDFPNEYAAMQAQLKAKDRDVNAKVHAAVQSIIGHLDPRLSTVERTTVADAATKHFETLHTAHPDYDTVIAKVPDWIKLQPSYLQPAMQAVYDGGATADVLQLVTDYKKAAGITTTSAAPAAPAPAAPATPAPVAPAPGAADLTPVAARRSTPVPKGTPDQNDYDGAFAEAAAAA